MTYKLNNSQMSSEASSNKVFVQGVGTFTVPNLPGAGEINAIATIPHGYSSDNLMFQVSATTDLAGTTGWTTLPFESNDGRLIMYAYLDGTNLYIVSIHVDSSGFGYPSQVVNYQYRVIIS